MTEVKEINYHTRFIVFYPKTNWMIRDRQSMECWMVTRSIFMKIYWEMWLRNKQVLVECAITNCQTRQWNRDEYVGIQQFYL